MIRIYKLVLSRHDDGYTLHHDALYFTDDQECEQCDKHQNILSDPIFTFNRAEQTITEITNPEEFGTAKHATHDIVTDINALRRTWINALASPQTIFTKDALTYFSDQFHRESLV